MARVEWLSDQSLGVVDRKIPKSLSTWLSQYNSAVVLAMALYSGSVEEQEIVACFLPLQLMGLYHKKTKKPIVESLSEGSPTQSES